MEELQLQDLNNSEAAEVGESLRRWECNGRTCCAGEAECQASQAATSDYNSETRMPCREGSPVPSTPASGKDSSIPMVDVRVAGD